MKPVEPKKRRVAASSIKPCSICGGSVVPLHYHVVIEQIGIEAHSVRQHQGLAMMLGNSSQLAEVMGTGIELWEMNRWEGTVCMKCQHEVLMLIGSLSEE